jgi:pantetheine-phosphate adenylyltransferase
MITKVFKDEPRITIDHYEGLTVDYCLNKGAKYLLRGLRTAADFEFERAIAQVNKALTSDVESVFLLTIPEHTPINSTIVRDIIRSGGDASKFVPSTINLKDYKGEEDL